MKTKNDWTIHYCTNCICNNCGEVKMEFLPYTCNAHTHGLEKYGHMDFQVVLALPPKEISYILNTLSQKVQAGEQFKAGDYVSGIFLDCNIRLDEYEETDRQILRVVIPDQNNHFPEHPECKPPYPLQLLKTDDLYCWKGSDGTCS